SQRDHTHLIKIGVGRAKKFTGDFRRCIWTKRLSKMLIFRKGNCFRRAVNGCAGCKNESFNPGHRRGLEKMQCATDIRVVTKLRVLNRWANARASSQMRDRLKFFAMKHVPHRRAVPKIDMVNLHVLSTA